MAYSAGSSPLARGLLPLGAVGPPLPGIIPARAGFTRRSSRTGARWPDHPRSRGVYQGRDRPDPRRGGSSPLARGLPGGDLPGEISGGIIPARAGFTHDRRHHRQARPDHPRSRGVYRGESVAEDVDLRIIPARAGFTWRPTPSTTGWLDHPRSRGVYVWPCRGPPAIRGSSPLARGLRGLVRGGGVDDGIIPARAGFTHHGPGLGRPPPDHPRSRGVYRPR